MSQELVNKLLRQYADLKTDRSGFESQWQSIADYGLGRREFSNTKITQGRKRMINIYDATYQLANDALAAALQSLLVNPAAQWFSLGPEDLDALRDEAAVAWFRRQTKRTYDIFNHPNAGFAPQSHEMLSDVTGFGTGGFFVGERPAEGIFFSARSLPELFITTNSEGRVDGVFRRYGLTSVQAVEKFGKELVGPKITQAFEQGKVTDEWEFVQVVQPRQNVHGAGFGSRRFPIASYDIMVADGRIMKESGYHEMPFMVPRWNQDTGESYGRGPGLQALPTQKALNIMERTRLIAAEKAVDPPLLISDNGMVSPARTQPGGQNIVRPQPGGIPAMQYLESHSRFDVSESAIAAYQNSIRGFFFHDLLRAFDDPRMSATQVLELSARTIQLIGPPLFRLQVQWLEPMIERVYGLALRGGLFEEPPESIRGQNIQINYVSPASKAQQNSDVQSLLTVVGTAAEWGQVYPDVTDNIDPDEALRALADALPGNFNYIRPQRQVRSIRDAKNAAAQEAAQQETLAREAEAAAKVIPLLQGQQAA